MEYVPLYIKTDYSLLQSMITIKKLISYAKNNNLNTLSITDNNMCGAYEFYKECIQNDIKPIIGMEINIKEYTFLLYAKNYDGYKNLIKLATINSERQINTKEIGQYKENLICIIPFKYKKISDKLSTIYEYVFIGYENEIEEKELGNNKIYIRETLCLEKEEMEYIPYLVAIKDGKNILEIENMEDKSLQIPNKIDSNNQKVNDLCNIKIPTDNSYIPKYECQNNQTSYEYLRELCKIGTRKRFGQTISKIYVERLKYELETINKMGFCDYFLLVWDYVKYAKDNKILVGPGRGSAAGSLVSYVLEITDIDPIKYQLIFERFLNIERITMPDIDIDFAFDKREQVIDYCIKKYGEKKVAGIITFGTLGSKQIIRDIGRTLNIDQKEIDYICKNIDSKKNLIENYKSPKFKKIADNYKNLFNISCKLEGLKRHTSIHAAGIVMCDRNIDEIIPLEKSNNMYLTGFSMEYLEELGLLKMDFLALKTLTVIDNIIKNIGEGIDFNNISLNDEKTLEIFKTGNTIGIFQFESKGMINFLKKMNPNTFDDIFAALALYRPGPMKSIDHYIKRKKSQEKIDYYHEDLIPILKSTYGILIYQEQIMQVANVMAGYSYGEADVLRRAMSKKKEDVLINEKEKFIKRAINKGYKQDLSETIYNLILKFASFGFNKSHSVAYAVIAYKMAYLKAHYPNSFMKILLNSAIGSSIDTKDYIYECKINNIEILSPNINKSDYYFIIENNKLYFPLSNIRNLGTSVIEHIIKSRNEEPYKDIFDFIKRTNKKIVNKKVIQSLIDVGCFDSFKINRKTLTESLDLIINYGELIKDLDEEYALKPVIEELEEYSKKDLMKKELETFGFYLTNHPVTEYRIKEQNSIYIKDISNYFDKQINLIANIESVKEIDTKNNDKMCFITVSDEIEKIDLIMFPKVYEKYNNLELDTVVKIKGKVEKRFDKYQIIVNELERMDNTIN